MDTQIYSNYVWPYGILVAKRRLGEKVLQMQIFSSEGLKYMHVDSLRYNAYELGSVVQVLTYNIPQAFVTLEIVHNPFGVVATDPIKVLALKAVCDLVAQQTYAYDNQLYWSLLKYLSGISSNIWHPIDYLVFKLDCLKYGGYSLDLSKCYVSGDSSIYYLSPKTGRAVSQNVGAPYHNMLFKIPQALLIAWHLSYIQQEHLPGNYEQKNYAAIYALSLSDIIYANELIDFFLDKFLEVKDLMGSMMLNAYL